MLSWRSGDASAAEDAAKQMRAAALNGQFADLPGLIQT
jgi:hypothetical protein